MLSAVSHTIVRRPSGATAGLITVEFNYELSYITTESLISIHPLAPLTRWYHAVCAQSAYRVHTAIVLSGNERSRCTLDLDLARGEEVGFYLATTLWSEPCTQGVHLRAAQRDGGASS